VSDWGSGFQTEVRIENTGGTAIDGWLVTLAYPEPVTVPNAWSALGPIVIDPRTIAFENQSWNATVAPGGATYFGFLASGGGGTPAITMSSGGQACDLGGGTVNESFNPYEGTASYVDPQWSARAQAAGAPAEIYDQSTAVWLDSTEAITGAGIASTMGLADHLDEALVQQSSAPEGELVVQLVVYNLPGRDCAQLVSNGEFGPGEIDRYKTEFIDAIADIVGQPQYAELRIVAVLEPFAIAYLPMHTSPRINATFQCDEVHASGVYVEGIAYAARTLAGAGIHNYLDAGSHTVNGWRSPYPTDDLFGMTADLYAAIFDFGATPGDVHGIATNTADYSALQEPFFDITDVVGGMQVWQTTWIDFNSYIDELEFALDLRDRMVESGFDDDLGLVIDTSRNGWGGPDRPTATSTSNNPDVYVNESRIDRRYSKQYRCNAVGAGLGERPRAVPTSDPHLHAYAWLKPPGVSDGTADDRWFRSPCHPDYGGMPGAPPQGEWFPAHFDRLLDNAWPPLGAP
jgi:cellulose 1,4-beta-cellobiosidase